MTNATLPAGVVVLERGWLSSNNILCVGSESAALIDSGYSTHAEQTVQLVATALGIRNLDLLLNTHLHSDHCGGNALLQSTYPEIQTHIPPGQAAFVSNWDEIALTYAPTGQICLPFAFNQVLRPGAEIRLADMPWQIHAAPGHDPHSVIFFEPRSRTLVSADALWENGFGVIFPELEGDQAFDEVAATLDLIEQLSPRIVIPGHGPVFNYSPQVLNNARQRLAAFIRSPHRHAHYAAKVLIKFKLLEQQHLQLAELIGWAQNTSYFGQIKKAFFDSTPFEIWVEQLTDELVRSEAAQRKGDLISNA